MPDDDSDSNPFKGPTKEDAAQEHEPYSESYTDTTKREGAPGQNVETQVEELLRGGVFNITQNANNESHIMGKSPEGTYTVPIMELKDYHKLTPTERKDFKNLIKTVGDAGGTGLKAKYQAWRLETNAKYGTTKIKEVRKQDQDYLKQQVDTAIRNDLKLQQAKLKKNWRMPDQDREFVSTKKEAKEKGIGFVSLTEQDATGTTYESRGYKTGEVLQGLKSFLKEYEEIPDDRWKNRTTCIGLLETMYQKSGVATQGPGSIDVTKECTTIANNLGLQQDKIAMKLLAQQKGYLEGQKLEKEFQIKEDLSDLESIFDEVKFQMTSEGKRTADFENKYNKIMGEPNLKTRKRLLTNLLGSQKLDKPGFMEGIKAKVKVKVGRFPGLEKLREEGSEVQFQRQMGNLLGKARSAGTSPAKRAQLIAELQATSDAAQLAGFKPQTSVKSFLASQEASDIADVVPTLTEEDDVKSEKLDVLKDVGSTIGSTVSEAGHGLGETLSGNTGSTMSDVSGEMASMASNIGKTGTDLDQFGKGGSPLESMSTEHQGDAPIHGSMKLKSVTLGKDTVGSGGLFEQTMAQSGAGVKLGDWDPYAFRQPEGQEKRGEKFLRERGAPTEGEAGPVGGDIQPGTMDFDFTAGHGPGTKKLDLGAGQFTRDTHQDITTKQRTPLDLGLGSSFGRSVAEGGPVGVGGSQELPSYSHTKQNLNLGLTDEQRPTTGVNLLGLGNVKAPNVTRVTATKKSGTGSLINQATGGSGLDTGHLIGNTPKKKRKLNLFGGMPR